MFIVFGVIKEVYQSNSVGPNSVNGLLIEHLTEDEVNCNWLTNPLFNEVFVFKQNPDFIFNDLVRYKKDGDVSDTLPWTESLEKSSTPSIRVVSSVVTNYGVTVVNVTTIEPEGGYGTTSHPPVTGKIRRLLEKEYSLVNSRKIV